jgi:hypothetical protein
MKLLTTFSLAAAAALAIMAFVGASSASATVLCTTNANCTTSHNAEGGQMYDAGDIGAATASNVLLTSSLTTISCDHSEVGWELASTGSSSQAIEVELDTLSFTGCEAHSFLTGTDPCEDVHLEPGWSGTVTLETAPNGAVKISNIFLYLECLNAVECIIGSEHALLPVKGGNPASVTVNSLMLKREEGSAFFCAEEWFFDAIYKATSGAAFIQKG